MDKIIFLDIDGVLALMHKDHDEYGSLFHDEFVNNLQKIIDETGAKIVISSSWRKNGLVEMRNLWKHRNLPGEIIDTTASLYIQKGGGICFWNNKLNEHPTPKINGYSIPRGCEIEYWLKDKGFYHCSWNESEQDKICKESGIGSYVIIDDDSDMLYSQRNNFVKTSGNIGHEDMLDMGYGLTKKCAELAIEILNSTKRFY